MKFYYLYKIHNNVNSKIYYGIHQTDDINDGYFGSGLILKRAIEKYGKENFEKFILKFFDNETTMYEAEKRVIQEARLKKEEIYNIREGGKGGWTYEEQCRGALIGGRIVKEKQLGIFSEEGKKKTMEYLLSDKHKRVMIYLRELALSEESKLKRKVTLKKIKHQQGERNSHFGCCWISNEILQQSKSIPKSDLSLWEKQGWNKGRKMNWGH